ncbi:MAG TPA: mannosyltransferase family protein [Solirubrobacteraceae bacterium]|nr:mannosyltransferase family protein [Solirubrobacteraceae bacterium]
MERETIAASGALRDVWRALWISRALVWVAGVGAVLALGRSGRWRDFDPAGLTAPFGAAGDALVAPAARWDAVWYLGIAAGGYEPDELRTAFFPLYPLLVRLAGAPPALLGDDRAAYLLAGIAVSLVAFAVALYVVHRLTALELGEDVARTTVWIVALFPTAWAFSAVYTESLFLALSAGALYAGRLGRWPAAGVLGLLAAATRSTGALLVVPLLILWLQHRHSGADATRGGRPGRDPAAGGRGPWWPLAWICAVPLGLAAYAGYLALETGDPWAPFTVQEAWFRELAGPLGGAWDGATAAFDGARQLLSGSRTPAYFEPAGGDPYFVAAHNLGNFAFLVFAAVAIVGAFRRLPAAYATWALLAVAAPVSYPVGPEPLASLPRYLAIVFPLHMWLALWAREHRAERVVLAASAAGLAGLTIPFATWEWVA